MKITFWGVRGSIPAPGPSTVKYGGNTACVYVETDHDALILDAGTGLRGLGELLVRGQKFQHHLLLSHNHWDHIQGFPFFLPAYHPQHQVYIYAAQTVPEQPDAILTQMENSTFPVPHSQLKATLSLTPLELGQFPMSIAGIAIDAIALIHPNGGFGYRLFYQGKVAIYLTDNELNSDVCERRYAEMVEFCQGADILIHDAQYGEQEVRVKKGWGHSSFAQSIALATAAGVKTLCWYSHDPLRSDNDLDQIVANLPQMPELTVLAAYEGLTITL